MGGAGRRDVRPGAADLAEARLNGSGAVSIELDPSIDVRSTLSVIRRGAGDPTWHDDADGVLWKAWRTPAGAVTVRLQGGRLRPRVPRMSRSADGPASVVTAAAAGSAAASRPLLAQAWGAGAEWVLVQLPRLLGADDDDTGFRAHHAPVAEARARFPRWRVPRTGMVIESLVPAIIEQRVTGAEAFGAYRLLVRRHGEPAPGPIGERRLVVAPSAAGWARIPSWEWVRAGVDSQRADTVMRALRVAGRLEQCTELPLDQARARLRAVPGVGEWTVAEVAHVALGDPDAVSFGDYHVAKNIGFALTGREVDDAGLADLLVTYAGHRYRVQRLLELSGAQRPRRGPRRTLPVHLPIDYSRRR